VPVIALQEVLPLVMHFFHLPMVFKYLSAPELQRLFHLVEVFAMKKLLPQQITLELACISQVHGISHMPKFQ
jgi:hypothetical protein